MKELHVHVNMYLELKEGETKEQAENRLIYIINRVKRDNEGFSSSEFFDSEVQEI